MTQMDWANKITPDMHILDLGSGHGGGSHAMAQRFGCKVRFNLAPGRTRSTWSAARSRHRSSGRRQGGQHQRAASGGMDRQVYAGGLARCCATRVIRLRSSKSSSACSSPAGSSSSQTSWAPTGGTRRLSRVSPTVTPPPSWVDRPCTSISSRRAASSTSRGGTGRITERYFRNMLSQITNNREEMNAKGITNQYLDNWVSSLTERAETRGTRAFSPGASSWREAPRGRAVKRNAPLARSRSRGAPPRRKPRIRVFDETTIVFMCYIKFDKPTVMILASLRRRALVMRDANDYIGARRPIRARRSRRQEGGVLRTLELACAAALPVR